MLTTYISGLVGETITKVVNLRGEVAGLDNPVFDILGAQTANGVIVPTFNDENDYLALMLDEDGSLTSNVGDYVRVEAITNKLTAANCTFENCGGDAETTVVSSLLAQMVGEKFDIVNV